MQKYGVNELRKMFLEFFESKGHLAMKSFSLVPHNDTDYISKKNTPSLLVQFQTPFDNLKKPISLKVHIQL